MPGTLGWSFIWVLLKLTHFFNYELSKVDAGQVFVSGTFHHGLSECLTASITLSILNYSALVLEKLEHKHQILMVKTKLYSFIHKHTS